jgi:hypothetical protein
MLRYRHFMIKYTWISTLLSQSAPLHCTGTFILLLRIQKYVSSQYDISEYQYLSLQFLHALNICCCLCNTSRYDVGSLFWPLPTYAGVQHLRWWHPKARFFRVIMRAWGWWSAEGTSSLMWALNHDGGGLAFFTVL